MRQLRGASGTRSFEPCYVVIDSRSRHSGRDQIEEEMKTCTHPIVAMLAGVTASPCTGGLGTLADDTTAAAATDLTAGFNWQIVAIVALSGIAIYGLWPKPTRDERSYKRRLASDAYRKRLEEIGQLGRKQR